MNVRTTWWLLGFGAAMFIYIAAFERGASTSENKSMPEAALFPNLEAGAVTTVEIVRSNSPNSIIRITRVNDQWRIVSPAYPAENATVDNFVRALVGLRQHTYITPQELASQSDWRSIYGFHPAQVGVLVEYGTNLLRFQVGAKTLVGSQVYLRRDTDPGLFVVDAPFLDSLPASVDEWRNPMLLTQERSLLDRVDRILVTNGPAVVALEFEPTNQLWKLTRPLTNRADFNSVLHLVQQVRNTRVSRFVTDDPRADLEPFGLKTPRLQMAFARGSNAVFHVQFGSAPTNDQNQVYARILSHSNVVLVPNTLVELLQRSDTAFRDRTLLSVIPASVGRVEIKTKKGAFAVQKEGPDSWRITEPFNAPADTNIIQAMLTNLSTLQIIDFYKDVVADFSTFGLAPPVRQYVLKSSVTDVGGTNLFLAQVDFGNTVGTNEIDKVFARRSDESSVYTVSVGDSLRLPQAAFEVRDRRLWNFDPRAIVSLTVTQNGQSRKLPRLASGVWSADIVLNAALEKIAFELAHLRALSWSSQGEEQLSLLGFKENPYQIAIEVNAAGKSQIFTLQFGRGFGSRRYAATVLEEDKPTIFQFPVALFAEIAQVLNVPPDGGKP